MSLFHFKKEPAPCACNASASAENGKEAAFCPEGKDGVCDIKVLGAGCKSCHALYENAKLAVGNLGLNIPVEYITDMQEIMETGVMRMPALVVNEKVVSQGKVLTPTAIEKLLAKE